GRRGVQIDIAEEDVVTVGVREVVERQEVCSRRSRRKLQRLRESKGRSDRRVGRELRSRELRGGSCRGAVANLETLRGGAEALHVDVVRQVVRRATSQREAGSERPVVIRFIVVVQQKCCIASPPWEAGAERIRL